MLAEAARIRLSDLDTRRFGIVTARADEVTSAGLPGVLDFCDVHTVELLIARCSIEDVAASSAMTSAGFLLMDTLVYYGRNLSGLPANEIGGEPIEPMRQGEEEQVEAIARDCFRDYLGHYHADRRLNRDACTEVYASWARSLCDADGDEVFMLVAGPKGRRSAFSGFRLMPDGTGELVLGAVLPAARGSGLYRKLTLAGMSRLSEMGATSFVTSTHLGNWGAQASWVAAGLHPIRAVYTFHRWFERR